MKKCKINNCKNKYYAKEYCKKHYDKLAERARCGAINCDSFVFAGGFCLSHLDLRIDKICKEDDCTRGFYSKGYCRKHNAYYKRNPSYRHKDYKECLAAGCYKKTPHQYCSSHIRKVRKGLDPNINYRLGENNGNWKGGIADYPNHAEMKKLRKIKLESIGNHCEECGVTKPSSKLQIHHLDGSKDNHSLENLRLLCVKCHKGIYHRGPRGPQNGKAYSPQYLKQNPHLKNFKPENKK